MSSGRRSAPHDEESIYRIPPYYYIHVLDQNTNVTKVEVGPKTFIRQDNEKVHTSDLVQLDESECLIIQVDLSLTSGQVDLD